jgi:hypothetical protein
MSYNLFDIGRFTGRPYRLYTFTTGATVLRLTDRDRAVTWDGNSYAARRGLRHGPIPGGASAQRDRLEIWLPRSDTLAQTLLDPDRAPVPTIVTIRRTHEGLADDQAQLVYSGRIDLVAPEGTLLKMTCSSQAADAGRLLLVPITARSCRHVHYGTGCRLDRADFEVSATATALTGSVLTVTEAALQPDGRYLGGLVRFGTALGWVENHVGTALTLSAQVDGLAAEITANGTASIAIAPGCLRGANTCNDVFDNLDNFGGFPYSPAQQPYGKSMG